MRSCLFNVHDAAEVVMVSLYNAHTGCTRSSGLVVALNAGSPEFLEALFTRDVDPQFKQDKDYIDARSLNALHHRNVGIVQLLLFCWHSR